MQLRKQGRQGAVILLMVLSGVGFGALCQVEVFPLLKPAMLLLPLQIAAVAYVIGYWRSQSPR